uniref:Reverse transcriptase domain-containing protein n=1 Tax=Glossina brevipalpis TaxID=37001 RepID=A0A1A9WBN4_9MUSC
MYAQNMSHSSLSHILVVRSFYFMWYDNLIVFDECHRCIIPFPNIRTPLLLKIAPVVSTAKSKAMTVTNDFRQISIPPALSKVVQHLIRKKIFQSIGDNVYKSQYAFRQGFSAILLLSLTDSIRKNTYIAKPCGLISLDLSKTFNAVCHQFVLEEDCLCSSCTTSLILAKIPQVFVMRISRSCNEVYGVTVTTQQNTKNAGSGCLKYKLRDFRIMRYKACTLAICTLYMLLHSKQKHFIRVQLCDVVRLM